MEDPIEPIFTYQPLPSNVKIGESDIHGYGIFAKDFIQENSLIGICHVQDAPPSGNFEKNLVRTPLGGFINHSNHPSCMILTRGRYWTLWTVKDLFIGDELTVNYLLYGCGE